MLLLHMQIRRYFNKICDKMSITLDNKVHLEHHKIPTKNNTGIKKIYSMIGTIEMRHWEPISYSNYSIFKAMR
jgi:serine protease inhibitor